MHTSQGLRNVPRNLTKTYFLGGILGKTLVIFSVESSFYRTKRFSPYFNETLVHCTLN